MTGKSRKAEEEAIQKSIREWAEEYAASKGWHLNRNDKQLDAVLKGLARNTARLGERYCPCRMRTGDEETDKEIICPCIFHEDELANDGNCHCRLFFRDE